MMSGIFISGMLHKSKLVLKCCVAIKLGCGESIIKEYIGAHRIELSEIAPIFPHPY